MKVWLSKNWIFIFIIATFIIGCVIIGLVEDSTVEYITGGGILFSWLIVIGFSKLNNK